MTGVRAPFPGLNYYGFEDADLFFGREEETRKMVGEILSTRLLVLFSPSGSGKTSLIQAGVRPQLEKLGYKTIYTRIENEPIPSLFHAVAGELDIPVCGQQPDLHDFLKQAAAQAGKPLVIFLDQFEEFFIVYRDRPDLRAEFVRQVARIRQDDSLHVFLVLSLREDYFAALHEFWEAIPSIFQNNANIRLKPFTDEAARRAVEEPLKAVGFSIEEGLTDLLVRDLKKTHNREEKDLSKTLIDPAAQSDPGIEPIKLQIVCTELWNHRDEADSRISITAYNAAGGVDSIVNRFIMKRLKKVSWTKRKLMERIFNALKTPDNTKRYCSIEDLTAQLNIKRKKHFKRLLGQLEQLDILRQEERGGTTWYEFRHDYLVREVVRWMEERREKRNRWRLIIVELPGIIFFIIIFIYLYIENNTYYLSLSIPEFNYHRNQREEIIFSPGFNPLQEEIGTGYFQEDFKDEAKNSLIEKTKITSWSKNIWVDLGYKLEEPKEWYFFYHIGQSRIIISKLREELKNKLNENARSFFELIATHDRTAFKVLYYSLSEDNKYLRFQSALALVNIGKEDQTIIKILYAALNDPDKEVRVVAAQALVKLGKTDRSVIDLLIPAPSDKDFNWEVRSSAAEALRNIGKPDRGVIDAFTAAMKDKNSYIRYSVASALVKLGKTDSNVIDVLVQGLKDSDFRFSTAETLVNLGKRDNRVIEGLKTKLKDKDSELRTSVARVLGNIGKLDPGAIMALIVALKDKDSDVRYSAATALVKLGKTDNRIIDTLIQALKDEKSYVCSSAAQALGDIGKPAKVVIETLVQALKDEKSYVRSSAAQALGDIGKPDKVVIEALVQALKDENSYVRSSTAQALVKLGNTESKVIDVLLQTLKDKNWDIRYYSAVALGQLGKTDHRVIDALIQALNDRNSEVSYSVLMALENLRKLDQKWIKPLIASLKDSDSYFRYRAAKILGNIDKPDKGIIEALMAVLEDKDLDVSTSAALSLLKLGKIDSRMIDSMIYLLKEWDSTERTFAAETLGKIGKPDKVVIEALVQALKDVDSEVRSSAAHALGNLLQSTPDNQLLEMLQHNDSGYRKAAAYALAEKSKNKKNPLSKETLQKIDDFRTKDPRPWVRLAAWDAFYLLHEEKELPIDD